jgi:hypothetical protein
MQIMRGIQNGIGNLIIGWPYPCFSSYFLLNRCRTATSDESSKLLRCSEIDSSFIFLSRWLSSWTWLNQHLVVVRWILGHVIQTCLVHDVRVETGRVRQHRCCRLGLCSVYFEAGIIHEAIRYVCFFSHYPAFHFLDLGSRLVMHRSLSSWEQSW